MSNFSTAQWIALQQPLIVVASMLTGKPIQEILAMEVHERAVLLHQVSVEIEQLLGVVATSTDPAGPGGVTLTEAEVATIVDEANDVPAAIAALKAA